MTNILILDKKGILGTILDIEKYASISQKEFEEYALEQARKEKKCPTGEIIVAIPSTGKEGIYTVKKKSSQLEIIFKEKEIKIIPKKEKSNDNKIDMDKKQELLLEFLKEAKKLPSKNEIYKSCPIGTYFKTCEKWSEKSKEIDTQIKKYVEHKD